MLTDLNVWHQDETAYKREALGSVEGDESSSLPGMLARYRAGASLSLMNWSSFRNLLARYHNALCTVSGVGPTLVQADFHKALTSCWSSADFMHVKNAITVGIQVLDQFPIMDTNGKAVSDAIEDLLGGKNGTLPDDLKHQCVA
jgi:hypothetical protein